MHALSVLDLLGAWERGTEQDPVERGLTLLAASCPETAQEDLYQWTVGQCDGSLLTLREWTFGTHLSSVALCPACGERMELSFETHDIRVTSEGKGQDKGQRPLCLSVDDYELELRLPTIQDLLDLRRDAQENGTSSGTARNFLLERCTLQALRQGREVTAGEWPEDVQRAATVLMSDNDPQANVQLALSCPHCGHEWQASFDIGSYFWDEINAWAIRLLREVHLLASAYGWREADILALSPLRRQFYLEMLNK